MNIVNPRHDSILLTIDLDLDLESCDGSMWGLCCLDTVYDYYYYYCLNHMWQWAAIQSSHICWHMMMSVAMVVTSAAGSDNSSTWACWLAAVTWRQSCHSVRPSHWRYTPALGSSQWQRLVSLSTAVLLATAGIQCNSPRWTLAEQHQSSKFWRSATLLISC